MTKKIPSITTALSNLLESIAAETCRDLSDFERKWFANGFARDAHNAVTFQKRQIDEANAKIKALTDDKAPTDTVDGAPRDGGVHRTNAESMSRAEEQEWFKIFRAEEQLATAEAYLDECSAFYKAVTGEEWKPPAEKANGTMPRDAQRLAELHLRIAERKAQAAKVAVAA